MKIPHFFRAAPSPFCLAVALMLVAPIAMAQETNPGKQEASGSSPEKSPLSQASASNQARPPALPQYQEETVTEDEEFSYEPLKVGDATQGLLAWQSSGEISSPTARPIEGAVASRSYERYLKSFEFPIPERTISSVKSTGGSAGK